jgi:hypothetical protein
MGSPQRDEAAFNGSTNSWIFSFHSSVLHDSANATRRYAEAGA